MKKIVIIYMSIAALFLSSCNYLDVVPDSVATIEYAFRNRVQAKKFLYSCYSYTPGVGNIWSDPGMSGGDEIWSADNFFPTVKYIARGNQNSSSPYYNCWISEFPEGGNSRGGSFLWEGIRDCNIFIDNIDKVPDMNQYEKDRWKAEAKFLKIYYHYYLFRMYGSIPVIDKNLEVSASSDQIRLLREPIDTVVNYLSKNLNALITELPQSSVIIEAEEAGRAYNLMAYALKAKVWLLAASPLFNGNTDYAGLVDSKGRQLFPQTYDPEKWKKAADAAKAAIVESEKQGKRLYDVDDPKIVNAPWQFKQQVKWSSTITDRWNTELIWGQTTNYSYGSNMNRIMARIVRLTGSNVQSAYCEWTPSMKMVEKYYSANGVPIEEDKDWSANGWYGKRYQIRPEPSSGPEVYYVRNGSKTVYMHYNREMRFYASLGFDRGLFFGCGYYKFDPTKTISSVAADEVKELQMCSKEKSGMFSTQEGAPLTGYTCKKLVNINVAMTESNGLSTAGTYYPFPVVRLSDLYLMYAEALNEYQGPGSDVYYYIDKVREKARLKGVVESWEKYSNNPGKPSKKEGMRDIIKRERTIELSFEGHRFWDLRRWKDIQELNEQPKGWNMAGETQEDFYKVVNVNPQIISFSVKDYLWPIKENELVLNPNIVQNYGW